MSHSAFDLLGLRKDAKVRMITFIRKKQEHELDQDTNTNKELEYLLNINVKRIK